MAFTMDGYTDLDQVANTLWEDGLYLGVQTREQLKTNIAYAIATLLDLVPEGSCREIEFYDACQGIVDCARDDKI